MTDSGDSGDSAVGPTPYPPPAYAGYTPPPESVPAPVNHPNQHGYLPPPPAAAGPYPPPLGLIPLTDEPEPPPPGKAWNLAVVGYFLILALLCAALPYLRFNGWTSQGEQGASSASADGWGTYSADAPRMDGHDTVYGYVFAVAAVLLVAAGLVLLWRSTSIWGAILALVGSTFLMAVVCVLGLDVASRRSYNYSHGEFVYVSTVGPGIWLAMVVGLGAAAGVLLALHTLLGSLASATPARSVTPARSATPGNPTTPGSQNSAGDTVSTRY